MSVVPSPRDGSGRYIATERLGEGGTAEVWRAWDRHSERWCALKVLFSRYADKKASRKRFLEEGRTVIRLNHRNIIEAWDLVEDAAQPFLVMEIAEGGSLRDFVGRHGQMAPRIAVDAAIQISKGVGAAHRIGVVHRDIKPHNILLTRRGLCKVTDFGIAQIIRDDGTTDIPDWTKTHHNTGANIAGTRGYMAPEQRTNGLAADMRTDIYGIGATLYTLLTGRVDTNLFAVDQDPSLMDGIHPELVPVLVQATKFRPEDRFQTVQELARALFDLRDNLPEVRPGAPRLAPSLPPEAPGPYGSSRNTDPPSYASYDSNSNSPVTGASGGFDRSNPPAPPPVAGSIDPSPGFGLPPHHRPNLILSGQRHHEEAPPESVPADRTRPLVVVATLLGILACLPTLDMLYVRPARTACARAHNDLQKIASQNSRPVDLVGRRAEVALNHLLSTRNPQESLSWSRRYVALLEPYEDEHTSAREARARLREPIDELASTLEAWRTRADYPGLVVNLGLEPRPPAPLPPRER